MTRQMLGCHDPIEMTKTAARSCSSLSQRHACQANKYRLFSPLIFVLNIYKIVYEVIGEDKIFRHERIFLSFQLIINKLNQM